MWIHLVALELIDGAGGGSPPEPVITGGHYGAWWLDKHLRMWERSPPAFKKLVEAIRENPEQAVELVPEIKQQIRTESLFIDYSIIVKSLKLQEIIAQKILNGIESRKIDEEDTELLLLMS